MPSHQCDYIKPPYIYEMNQCLTNFHIHEMNRCMFLMPGAATGIETRIVRKVK